MDPRLARLTATRGFPAGENIKRYGGCTAIRNRSLLPAAAERRGQVVENTD